MWAFLLALKRQGFQPYRYCLVISHDLGSTLKEYDRFLLLNKQLIAIGSRDDVITASNIRTAYGESVILLQREEL